VNPWVERTQWLPYLVGMERADLMACIKEPVAEPDLRSDNEAEPVEAAIWGAMDVLSQGPKWTVITVHLIASAGSYAYTRVHCSIGGTVH
jgi:hypothetical protein